jgi:hypothetical protein
VVAKWASPLVPKLGVTHSSFVVSQGLDTRESLHRGGDGGGEQPRQRMVVVCRLLLASTRGPRSALRTRQTPAYRNFIRRLADTFGHAATLGRQSPVRWRFRPINDGS